MPVPGPTSRTLLRVDVPVGGGRGGRDRRYGVSGIAVLRDVDCNRHRHDSRRVSTHRPGGGGVAAWPGVALVTGASAGAHWLSLARGYRTPARMPIRCRRDAECATLREGRRPAPTRRLAVACRCWAHHLRHDGNTLYNPPTGGVSRTFSSAPRGSFAANANAGIGYMQALAPYPKPLAGGFKRVSTTLGGI